MKNALLFLLTGLPFIAAAQHDHHVDDATKTNHNHLAHVQASREWNIPNMVNTKFSIGSVTKQFTAACILQLAEQNKLSLEDKLSKYIPDYPKGDSITVHMLLNHTSGIVNYTNLPEFWPKAILPLSTNSMIALFKNKPLDFSPGTKWNYSNSGYFLLGVTSQKK